MLIWSFDINNYNMGYESYNVFISLFYVNVLFFLWGCLLKGMFIGIMVFIEEIIFNKNGGVYWNEVCIL